MYRFSYSGGLRMPELGVLDRAIFILGITFLSAFEILIIPVFLLFENRVPFMEHDVVAYSNRAGILGFALAFLLLVLVISVLVGGYKRKFPIFGVKGVNYGDPEWNPVYPLMMSTRNSPEHVRWSVREGRQLVCIFLVIALLAGLIFGISLFSGNRLCEDGSIRWIWGFGWEAMRYEPEAVEQVTLRNRLVGSGKGITPRKYEILVEFRATDGRTCSFFLRDFRRDGTLSQAALLEQIMVCYEHADARFLGGEHLEDLFYDQQYSGEDQAILWQLFGN